MAPTRDAVDGRWRVSLEADARGEARVLIVEDHPVVMLGLRSVLDEQDGLVVVGEADGVDSCLDEIAALSPDLLVLPLRLEGELHGIELCREAKSRAPEMRVLVYTSFASSGDVSAAYLSGADSFVHKGATTGTLLGAIEATLAGRRVWQLGGEEQQSADALAQSAKSGMLTSREREVLGFMLQRFTNAEIARELFVGVPTVKTHVSSILQKLGIASRRELFRAEPDAQ